MAGIQWQRVEIPTVQSVVRSERRENKVWSVQDPNRITVWFR